MLFTPFRVAKLLVLIVLLIIPTACEHDFGSGLKSLNGYWSVAQVKVTAILAGVPVSQTDNNPIGYVEFNDDSTGIQKFEATILGNNYKRDSHFKYRLTDQAIFMNEGRPDVVVWQRVINSISIQRARFIDTLAFPGTRVEFDITLRKD